MTVSHGLVEYHWARRCLHPKPELCFAENKIVAENVTQQKEEQRFKISVEAGRMRRDGTGVTSRGKQKKGKEVHKLTTGDTVRQTKRNHEETRTATWNLEAHINQPSWVVWTKFALLCFELTIHKILSNTTLFRQNNSTACYWINVTTIKKCIIIIWYC